MRTIKTRYVSKAAPHKTILVILKTTVRRLRRPAIKAAKPQAAILPMIHSGHRKQAKKGGKCPGEDLRINKQVMVAAVNYRKMIISVPVAQPNAVVREDTPLAVKLTRSKAWMKGGKLFRMKTAG